MELFLVYFVVVVKPQHQGCQVAPKSYAQASGRMALVVRKGQSVVCPATAGGRRRRL